MKKVLCPGEALIDFVANENNQFQSSESFLKKAGGAPANAAGAIAKFGVESYFLGTVGDDHFGLFLEEQMNKFKINTKYLLKKTGNFTTLAFVSIAEDGERDFIFARGADSKLNIEDYSFLNDFDCIHFASATAFLGDELENTYDTLLNEAIKKNMLISFDANYRDALFNSKKKYFIKKCKEYISKSNIVKLSEEEALLISGENDLHKAGRKISQLGCGYLLITLGNKGTYIYSEEQMNHVETIKVKPVDTTGAGDAFIGTVIAKAVQEKHLNIEKMINIVKLANKVGALTTENYGALESIPSLEKVLKNKS